MSVWPAPGAGGAVCPSPLRYGKTCAQKASVLFTRCISFLQGAKARGLAFNQTSATVYFYRNSPFQRNREFLLEMSLVLLMPFLSWTSQGDLCVLSR